MHYSLYFAAATAAMAPQLVSAAPATSSCTTVTKTASFDDLPTGTVNVYEGLEYQGWEVVRAADTPFATGSSSDDENKLLRLIGTQGVVRAAEPGYVFDDSLSNSFLFGCANKTDAQSCVIAKTYAVPCHTVGCYPNGTTYSAYYNADKSQGKLELGTGYESFTPHNITWGAADANSPDLRLYIDEYKYFIANC